VTDSATIQQLEEEVRGFVRPGTPLEELDRRARERGRARLQRGVIIYCPLYVSNVCVSGCRYCGFRAGPDNRIQRRRLDPAEVAREASELERQGVRNLLLVAGDDPGLVTGGHLRRMLEAIRSPTRELWLEIEPQSVGVYERLVEQHGVTTYVHYQETYDPDRYRALHPSGPKQSYEDRLEVTDRAIAGGAQRVGMGILLGLADPVHDCAALIEHVRQVHRRHPAVRISVNLPRLCAVPTDFDIPVQVNDELFVRLLAALSCLLPLEIDLALTTRESPALRDRLLGYGATLLSAGSRTSPGAYAGTAPAAGEQFEITDRRSVAEVVGLVEAAGLTARPGPVGA
jgi:2-iminoacetate synthase